MIKRFPFYILMICGITRPGICTQCPAGFVPAHDDYAIIVSGNECPDGYIATETFPACPNNGPCVVTCPMGYALRTNTGLVIAAHPEKVTTPSLQISDTQTSCWISLAPGKSKNTIHIKHQGQIYHTTE